MANTKTSQEVVADSLVGDELVRIVQDLADKRTTTRDIANLYGSPKTVDVTIYTTLQEDNKRVLVFTDAIGVTVTIPFGLTDSFSCEIVQLGLGEGLVTVSGAVGVSVYSSQGFIRTATQYSKITLTCIAQDVYILSGDGLVEGT